MVRPYLALAIATCMNQTRRQTRSRSVVFQKFQQPVLIFIGSHSWSVGCVQIEHPGHGNSWLLDRVELYEIADGNHGLWAKQSSLFWMESYTGGGYPKQLRITSMLTWMGKKNCKTKIRGKRRNSYIYSYNILQPGKRCKSRIIILDLVPPIHLDFSHHAGERFEAGLHLLIDPLEVIHDPESRKCWMRPGNWGKGIAAPN